jgi:hypothetical protein
MVKKKNEYMILVEELNERGRFEGLGTVLRIMLKWILKK